VIVDSSAVVAIFLQEPGYEAVLTKLEVADVRAIGGPTLAETGIVLTARLRRDAIGPLARFLQRLEVLVVPFGEDHWQEAVEAFERYGRGRHDASLNFGDCMSYAIAKLADEPLLCTGRDFARTDLEIA
jgi:ribonuclease VapC